MTKIPYVPEVCFWRRTDRKRVGGFDFSCYRSVKGQGGASRCRWRHREERNSAVCADNWSQPLQGNFCRQGAQRARDPQQLKVSAEVAPARLHIYCCPRIKTRNHLIHIRSLYYTYYNMVCIEIITIRLSFFLSNWNLIEFIDIRSSHCARQTSWDRKEPEWWSLSPAAPPSVELTLQADGQYKCAANSVWDWDVRASVCEGSLPLERISHREQEW